MIFLASVMQFSPGKFLSTRQVCIRKKTVAGGNNCIVDILFDISSDILPLLYLGNLPQILFLLEKQLCEAVEG